MASAVADRLAAAGLERMSGSRSSTEAELAAVASVVKNPLPAAAAAAAAGSWMAAGLQSSMIVVMLLLGLRQLVAHHDVEQLASLKPAAAEKQELNCMLIVVAMMVAAPAAGQLLALQAGLLAPAAAGGALTAATAAPEILLHRQLTRAPAPLLLLVKCLHPLPVRLQQLLLVLHMVAAAWRTFLGYVAVLPQPLDLQGAASTPPSSRHVQAAARHLLRVVLPAVLPAASAVWTVLPQVAAVHPPCIKIPDIARSTFAKFCMMGYLCGRMVS